MEQDKKTDKRTITYFKWLFVLLSAVLITTGTVSYHIAAHQLKEQLARRCHALAATVAEILSEDSDGYAAFLKDMDLESQYYQNTKALMMKLKSANAEYVTYIYSIVQTDENTAMYVIGGEPPDSPVYTAPGVVDHAMTEAWRTAFREQKAVLGEDFIRTPYGIRLSSYAPIFHRKTGEFMGLVGADVILSQYGGITKLFITQTVIGLLAGLFVFAAAISRLSGSVNLIINKERYDAEFARGIVATGREHYQKMDEIYGKLRILNHDYKYHLNATRKMLQVGDTQGANKYLTDIEQKLFHYDLQNFCTNHVINALVADYAERCKKMSIPFDVSLNIPEPLSVPDYDLCIILGNLLENAVNACGKLEQNRSIKLESKSIQNQLLFMVKNSFDGNVAHKDGIPFSKKDNGGFGLRSVKEVIAGHGGDILFEWDNNCFTAYVALKLQEKEKNS